MLVQLVDSISRVYLCEDDKTNLNTTYITLPTNEQIQEEYPGILDC